MFRLAVLCLLALTTPLAATSPKQLQALYSSLDAQSITQQLAFHQLYSQSSQGKKALQKAWQLMAGSNEDLPLPVISMPVDAIIDLANRRDNTATPTLSDDLLSLIEKASSHLPHKNLKGHLATTEAQVLQLSNDEIDCARALFLSQFTDQEDAIKKIRYYEAVLDMMAMQILAKLPDNATPYDKIDEINRFIFDEMWFRFPPHSSHAENIDIYTFLPSVMDSRRGVCLGVSVLYLSIAQRLDLPLEIVTPPGHIYLRYNDKGKITNIETTARGIHMPDDVYLSVNLHTLPLRQMKEVPGLVAFNQASVYLQQQQFDKALPCYEQAIKYAQTAHVKELLGICHLFTGNKKKGRTYLQESLQTPDTTLVAKDVLIDDLLSNAVAIEDAKVLFMKVDEKRQSLLDKKQALIEVLGRNPKFRTGWFYLSVTWLQLHRYGEALDTLQHYHTLHDGDPTAEYYLAAINLERFDYNRAWDHLHQAEELVATHDYQPKTLKELRQQLTLQCPEQL